MSATVAGTSSAELVLRALLTEPGPRTRAELAVACGLSRPTVFAAVERLQSLGLVAPVGQRSGVPGRTAALFDLTPGLGCVAGIDVGGTNLRVGVGDLRGRLLSETRRRTQARGGARVVRQAATVLRGVHQVAAPDTPLLAVGVSIPGVVDERDRVVRFAWNVGQAEPYDFLSRFGDAIDAPLLLENNVNLAALGEMWQGAARDLHTFAVISVGAGIGAGVVHNNVLLRGAHGAAGEVAFLPLRTPPRTVRTVEDEAGAVALLKAAQARDDWSSHAPKDVAELFEQARRGEPAAVELVDDECQRIGETIAAVCAVVDPQAVILAGGVGSNDLLIERATAVARSLSPDIPPVLRSGLGERASLIGALSVAVQYAQTEVVARVAEQA